MKRHSSVTSKRPVSAFAAWIFETMPAEDQQLPVKWNGSDLCRITGKGSVYYRREDKLMVQEDALVKANAVLQ